MHVEKRQADKFIKGYGFAKIEERQVKIIMKTALTIAGSDSSGGAGIQADIKTMTAHGVYAMSAITALTAQNTTGVTDIMGVEAAFLGSQLDSIFTDIYPDAIKTGMIFSAEQVHIIAQKLEIYQARNIVVDPVMVATSGSTLTNGETVEAMKKELLPMATVITPNIFEAQVLSGMEIRNENDMITAAKKIYEAYGCAVLCKGGHLQENANDLLYAAGELQWFYGDRISNPNTHGTGCTLSSAIAANLAKGKELALAIKLAKQYLSGAIGAGLNLGKGRGPLNHVYTFSFGQKPDGNKLENP